MLSPVRQLIDLIVDSQGIRKAHFRKLTGIIDGDHSAPRRYTGSNILSKLLRSFRCKLTANAVLCGEVCEFLVLVGDPALF